MKKLIFILFALNSFSSFAQVNLPIVSVKERLRIHMWQRGVQKKKKISETRVGQVQLPEELERALNKI